MTESALLPCPFCGGIPDVRQYPTLSVIGCLFCGFSRSFNGPYFDSALEPGGKNELRKIIGPASDPEAHNKAIAAWNHRPPSPSQEWLDISTAPRDGKPVLVFCPPRRRVTASYEETSFQGNATGKFAWITGIYTDDPTVVPTHWMPLPSPPTPPDKVEKDIVGCGVTYGNDCDCAGSGVKP